MALDGTYQVISDENTLEYFKVLGVPEELANKMAAPDMLFGIESEGDNYTFKFQIGGKDRSAHVTLGKELTEPTGTGDVYKVVISLENGKLVTRGKRSDGVTIERQIEVDEKGLTYTMTTSKAPIVSKRIMKRI